MADTVVKITLIIKGSKQTAIEEVDKRLVMHLNNWLVEDVNKRPPYGAGALLWWGRVDDPDARCTACGQRNRVCVC